MTQEGRGYPSIDSLKEISKYFSVTIDDFSFILIVLPLYPNTIDGYIYSVNLFAYAETTALNRCIYWILFVSLMVAGIVKIMLTKLKPEKEHKITTNISMVLNIVIVLFLAITRETYAITVAFLLLIIKGMLLLKCIKAGG